MVLNGLHDNTPYIQDHYTHSHILLLYVVHVSICMLVYIVCRTGYASPDVLAMSALWVNWLTAVLADAEDIMW